MFYSMPVSYSAIKLCVSAFFMVTTLTFGIDEGLAQEPLTFTYAEIDWVARNWGGAPPLRSGGNRWWGYEPAVELVDEKLILRVINDGEHWYSAEINSVESSMRYGRYCFYLESQFDLLDTNLVFGMFLYEDDEHEIDIELSQWGDENSPFNVQYVLQPSDSEHLKQFNMVLSGMYTTHCINWKPTHVVFSSYHGHSREHLEVVWVYTRDSDRIPHELNTKLAINLWLVGGKESTPVGNGIYEVAIVDITHPNVEELP